MSFEITVGSRSVRVPPALPGILSCPAIDSAVGSWFRVVSLYEKKSVAIPGFQKPPFNHEAFCFPQNMPVRSKLVVHLIYEFVLELLLHLTLVLNPMHGCSRCLPPFLVY